MEKTGDWTPFADEAFMAQLAYDRWERQNAESMAEYIYRRRSVDLSLLVQQAIREELNENQQRIIRMRYYDNCTPGEIARRTGVHPSTVIRTLQRAEDKLYRALRYVVEYQQNLRRVTSLPLAVRQAMAVDAARRHTAQSFAARLRDLRTGENISADAAALAAGIDPARLCQLENGDDPPTAEELLRLAAFYAVSVDRLLKGDAA